MALSSRGGAVGGDDYAGFSLIVRRGSVYPGLGELAGLACPNDPDCVVGRPL
jgi:hypothetical protein